MSEYIAKDVILKNLDGEYLLPYNGCAKTVNGVGPDSAGNVSVVDITGNAGTATKLQNSRKINGVAFDGTKDITVEDSTKLPLNGNAASATKLATARKINGVSFDGTSDINVKDDTKLPLSGGTMTGTIIFNKVGQVVKSPGDDGVLRFDGGSDYNKGAFLSLHGMNHSNAGAFQLSARNRSGDASELWGYPDGTLKWGGSNVVTEASGNAPTATTAAKLGMNGNSGIPMTFYWDGKNGQPDWVWGGNDGTNMYVYNPSSFVVNYADGSNYTAATPNIHFNSGHNNLSWALPPGGTWRCFLIYNQAQSAVTRDLPGGSTWSESPGNLPWFAFIVKVS